MVDMIESVIQQSQIYFTRISNWKSNSQLSIEVGPYLLNMAQTKEEVIGCFKLRHEVFCREMAGVTKKTKLDFDKYDSACDHLMIIHKPTEEVVGTYRMRASKNNASAYYTESEFLITDWIENQEHTFVELGRACIQKDHRRGIVISLLWRGIAEYMKSSQAESLIGCSSVKVTDARSAALIYRYFEVHGMLHDEVFMPLKKYEMKDFLFWLMVFSQKLSEVHIAEAEEKIPSLLKSYLKAGAKVASYPAYDAEFKCIDFVTLLKRSDLDQKLVRKFNT